MKITNILIREQVKTLLSERFINLNTEQEIKKHIDTIWEILQKSYAPIGGFKSAKSKEDLVQKAKMVKMVRREGKIVAVKVYKDSLGRKSIAGGTDGSLEGKQAFIDIAYEDIKLKRAWGEFSGKAETIMLKQGGTPIPNRYASKILAKPIIELDPDGYHYTREIQGIPHKKILIGDLHKLLPQMD